METATLQNFIILFSIDMADRPEYVIPFLLLF
jgi:hypothetical protein